MENKYPAVMHVALATTTFLLTMSTVHIIADSMNQVEHNATCKDVQWNNTIVDISSVIDSRFNETNLLIHDISSNMFSHANNHSRPRLYYEADLDEHLREKILFISNCVRFQTEDDLNKPEILLSLRFTSFDKHVPFTDDVPTNFVSILPSLVNNPIITMISFQHVAWSNNCLNGFEPKIFIADTKKHCRNCGDVRIGYTVTNELLQCRALLSNVNAADFIVVKILFNNDYNFFESFNVFKEYMDSNFQKNRDVLSQLKRHQRSLYFHMEYSTQVGSAFDGIETNDGYIDTGMNGSEIFQVNNYMEAYRQARAEEVAPKYECLFNKFIQEWRQFNDITVIQKHRHCSYCEEIDDQYVALSMIPEITGLWNTQFPSSTGCNNLRSIRVALNHMMKQGIYTVLLDEGNLELTHDFMATIPKMCLNVTQNIAANRNGSNDLFKTIITIPMRDIDHEEYNSSRHMEIIAQTNAFIGSSATEYSCELYKSKQEMYHLTESKMQWMSEFCKTIILYMELDLDLMYHPRYRHKVVIDVKESYFQVQSKWPNKTVILKFSGEEWLPELESKGSLYCSSISAVMSDYYEAIYTWAEISKIPVITYAGYNQYEHQSPGRWYLVLTDDNVLPALPIEFSLYLRRSYNVRRVFGKWTDGMYPCLTWLTEVPTSGISFVGSPIGTYTKLNIRINDDGRRLLEEELATMLLFMIATTPMVELELAHFSEMNEVLKVLNTPGFKRKQIQNSIGRPEIFLNIPLLKVNNQTEMLMEVGQLLSTRPNNSRQNSMINIHFSESLGVRHKLSRNLLAHLHRSLHVYRQHQIGLQLHDCATIVTKLTKIELGKDGKEVLGSHVSSFMLDKWSYIVCTIPLNLIATQTELEMQKFLESHIYIKTIVQTFFPNLKNVYIKLLPIKICESGEENELLRHLGHITEFARGYNISYLMLHTFKSESDETTGREKTSNENVEDTGQETFWIIFGLVTAFLFLTSLVVLVVVVIRAQRNARILSDEDVQEFVKGRKEMMNPTGDQINYNSQFMSEKYNNDYEIRKGDVFLDRNTILGMGNFGVVYKALMNSKQCQHKCVAVKMPQMGCHKQTFLGMLRELKLLAYLGKHQNVVGFIDAYTKEIRQGTLYIVMELCTGGSLLTYLRNIKNIGRNASGGRIFPDLVRFCLEIASGMKYISGKNVIHGDLSARNVLLDELNVCKIADFGLARKLYCYQTYVKQTEEALPCRWMAYESLSKLEFSTMSDVWSFGVTVWEIFSLGGAPYPGLVLDCEFVTKLEQGFRLSKPTLAMSEIFEFISECWNINPDERPSFSDLLSYFVDLLPYNDML